MTALGQPNLLEAVVKHKTLFFRSAWAKYEQAKPGSFHLVPPKERLAQLEADYNEMREVMIFGEAVLSSTFRFSDGRPP